MAFSYTVTALPETGKRKHMQGGGGVDLVHYEGTWTAGGDTAGTIDLTDTTKTNVNIAAVKIFRYKVFVDAGTVTAQVKEKMNSTHVPGASDGVIGIILCAANNTGTYWADVVV